jgi:hypothetical protein
MTVDPFDFMDFSLEEALEEDEKLRQRPAERDGRICLCGHPVSRHTVVNGLVFCKPTRMECPCKKVRAVIDTNDVRPFLRKTEGSGPMHALGRGLAAAITKGLDVVWLVEKKCDRCGTEGPVAPVPVTQRGGATRSATGFDALLCQACRQEV